MNSRFFLFFAVAASACAAPVMPQSVTTNGELRLLPPAAFAPDAWRLNNYKKQQRVALEYPQERTPSGAPCLRIDFQSPEGGCNVISPELEPDGVWRHGAYEAVVLWVKGDAGGQRLSLTASSKANRCVWQIPLDTPDWKPIILPVSAASSQDRQPLDLGTIKRLAFSCPAVASVMVGDIRLRPAALHLPVERPRSFVIPARAGGAPVIDGRLDDPAWQDALVITNFVLTRSGDPATEATGVRLLSDGQNLYIGARMADADTADLRAGQTARDAPVWKDDCLEVFVDETLDSMSYRHLVINPAGTVEDYHYHFSQEKETFVADHAWNPAFSHGEQVLTRAWTVELSIPLDALGIVEGTPFGFQLARENHGIQEYSALVPTERFNTPATFAVGVIGRATQEVLDIGLSMQTPGNMQVSGRVAGPGLLALEAVVADPAGGTLRIPLTAHSDTTGAFVAPFVIPTPLEGPYRVTVSGAFNGDPLVPCAMRFVMSLPSEIAFGDIYLNPQPKECSFRDGVFVFDGATPIVLSDQASARSRQTARFLRTELHHDLFGMLPPITAMPGEGAAFRLALREDAGLPAAVKDTAAALPAEGYLLAVAPEGVTLVGADEPGLYYGVVTLIHLARAHVLKHHAPELGAVEIRDWPDLPLRFVTLWASSFKRPKEPRNDLGTLKQYLKEVIAGNKFNAFSLMLDYEFPYDAESRITEICGMFSREDYRELARFAREHFIEFIPALQSGGHSRHFVRAHPQLQEPGFDNTQVNVLHADWHQVLFACYRDILSAVPDAKHFFIWHDEWWHHPTGTVSATVDGKPRWEIFRDEILANHRFFAERGIRMIMCSDMLAKDHNGGGPLHLSRGLADLPKDIIMLNWSVRTAPGAAQVFHDQGFPVWDVVNQFRVVPPQDVSFIQAYGVVQYGHYLQTFWYSRDAVLPDYVHAPFRGGQYAWNLKRDSQLPIGEWRRRYLNSVMSLYNFPKRRTAAWRKLEPVDLVPCANLSTTNWFGQPDLAPVVARGPQTVAFTPMLVATAAAHDVVAATAGQREIAIPVEQSGVKSIFLLQGSYLPTALRTAFKKRSSDYLYGVPLGELRIEYDDGPSEILPLRMGINTLETTPLPAARFMFGTRYTHDVRTVGGENASLYLIEWANPYVGRRIRRLVWVGYGTEATPVLFALTLGF